MTTYATLVLRTEAYGIRPDFQHRRRSKRRALQTESASGHVIRRTVNERETRAWTLSWNDAPEGIATHLTELYRDAAGPVLPMAYTPVGLTDVDAVDVRFVEKSLVIVQTGPTTYRIRVDVEEVL